MNMEDFSFDIYCDDIIYINGRKINNPTENGVNFATVEKTKNGIVIVTYNDPTAKENMIVQQLVNESIERLNNNAEEAKEHEKKKAASVPKVQVGLKIHFLYNGETLSEDVYGGQNVAWYNFHCLYPDAEVIAYQPIFRDLM